MAKEYDKQILTELDSHIDAILDLLQESDMEDDAANQIRDELYAYLNPQQLTLQLIIKNLS